MLKPVTVGSNLSFLLSGVLRRVSDERECFATLRTIQSASAGTSSSCRCAGRRPAAADAGDSLLVVQSLTSLEALRAALQPVCGSGSTGASETVVSTLPNASLQSRQVARQQRRDSLWRSQSREELLILFPVGYNAIWNPGEGSVTTFLQCKGCSSQSSGLPAAVVAAEVRYPSDTTRDQVNFDQMLSVWLKYWQSACE